MHRSSPASAGPPPVIVVEDHADTRRFMSRVLQMEGFAVFEAATCDDALSLIERERRAVLVSDLALAECSGLAMMREVSRRGLPVRGVAVSGHAGPEHVSQAKAAGFERYLVKPFRVDGLVAVIRELADELLAA